MNPTPIDFLLAPDGASARRVKIRLAEKAPGLYRMAGTWPELVAQSEAVYLLPPEADDWAEKLKLAALRQKDAFWASSLEIAPREALAELDAALHRLLDAAGPAADWQDLMDRIPVNRRLNRRLSDLSRLLDAVDGLPESLQKMAHLLAAQDAPLRTIRVYYLPEMMDLNAWQTAVLKKIERDAPPRDPQLQAILETALAFPETTTPALAAVRNLYSGETDSPRNTDGVRIIATRDSLAEAEITAGLIQNALAGGGQMTDIGLLLPDDAMSLVAVENVFNRCGLPLSGFHRPIGRRDIGRETLRAFLLCLKKPAPIMAIASLLTSPLMPWSMDEGHTLAQTVMGGDVLLKSRRISNNARKVMALLNKGVATPADLQRALNRFTALLTAEDDTYDHYRQVQETAEQLQSTLAGRHVFDWDPLLYQTNPVALSTATPVEYWQEGLPVFHEGALPWCNVNHLFVLGFNDGHYPAGAGASAVFTEAEWEEIAAAGWPVATNDLIRQRQRDRFAAQLAAATDNLTILFSRRDAGGQALEPSASLVFLARCLGVESDDFVLDLDRSEDVQKIADLPLADKTCPSPPRELPVADIDLQIDLLKVFSRKKGALVPISPSAADNLMVSPFAWLLGRLGCEPREWGTDDFDVMTAGTLAHRVFEELFQAGRSLPSEDEITKRVPKILQEWTLQIAPFLRSPDWRVERYKFESEVLRAAVHWQKLLASCKATVVGAEQWLRGQHGEIPLHGQSDLLVQLPSGKLLVVDYKKSASGKRRDRMVSGFDLQAHLYRLMIQTGGLTGFASPPDDIGIVYYLLNDTTALADSPVYADGSVPGWEELSTDISSQAMLYLDRRLAQIRKGIVQLNTSKDEDWWKDNASLPIYALDNSPLLRLFMHVEEVSS